MKFQHNRPKKKSDEMNDVGLYLYSAVGFAKKLEMSNIKYVPQNRQKSIIFFTRTPSRIRND